ncbi:hypothetical protein FXN61_31690 [Lentzea sp. PSKA42]|uniref:Glycosyltransferase RgtA/B/C/D-like domain-containing protein n=1 Tax=Lentzea indica TaxID=2604800 RepID=A0ABX1FQ11_9PSEU|nr:hypothetical protein [Lentzea indica]
MLMAAMRWDMNSIPQDWDAAYHANGIRYIAETGEGSLYATGKVNWYELKDGVFYPNAYHLVGALVFKLTGAAVPAVLNANTVLLPGLLALALVAMIRHFNGRAVTAGFTALVTVACTSATYDNLWRGPLLTFTLGIAVMPVLAIAMDAYLKRSALDTGVFFGGVAVGLLAIHSSTLFGGILFVLPMFIQRWWGNLKLIWRDALKLIVPAVVAVVVTLPHLLGALAVGGKIAIVDWPSTFPVSQSIGSLLTFQHVIALPQYWLALALWIGLIFASRLGDLRWLLGSAAFFGGVWVLTASYSQPWVARVTSPWWNDQWRLIALACVPLVVVAGHGLAQVYDFVKAGAARLSAGPAPYIAGGVVVAVFAFLSQGLYFGLNKGQVEQGYANQPGADRHNMVVSPDEVLAFQELTKLVKPGEKVLNDRRDGTVWMYALAGVQPVVGHYDGSAESPSVHVLQSEFNDYASDSAVRDAVKHLNVRYVIVDTGYVHGGKERVAGLRNLDGKPFVQKIYSNQDSTIYKLVPEPGAPVSP